MPLFMYQIKGMHQKSLQQFEHIIRQTQDAILTIDNSFTIKTWNNAAANLYGYSANEALGQNFVTLLKSRLSESERIEALEELHNNGFIEGEYEYSNKNGERVFIKGSITILTDSNENIEGYAAVHRNLTTQKVLEEKLKDLTSDLENQVQKKTNQLNNIFERITDAYIELDDEGICTYVNQKAGEILKREPASLTGKRIWTEYAEAVHENIYQVYKNAVTGQEAAHVEEFYGPLNLWFEIHLYPSTDGVSIFFRDITANKKTQEEAKSTNQRFLLQLANTPLAVIEWNAERLITFWSKKAEEIFEWTTEEAIGKNIDDLNLIYKDDGKVVGSIINSLLSGSSKSIKSTNRNNTKSGKVICCEWYNSIIKNEDGETVCCMSLVQDVSIQKSTEMALKESENHLQIILESEPECVILLSETGVVQQINAAGLKMFEADDILQIAGKKITGIITSGYKQAFDDLNRRIFEGIPGKLEFEIKAIKGTIKIVETHAVPFYNSSKKIVSFLGITRDITEKKKAEETLRINERQLDLVLNSSFDIIFLLEVNNGRYKFIFVNKAGYKATGVPENGMNGKYVDEVIPEPSLQIVLKNYAKAIETKTMVSWEEETPYPAGVKTALVRVTPVFNELNECFRLVGFIHDITENKMAEAVLKEKNEQLRNLSAHLQEVREEERTHIAREIHDELGQRLTGIRLDISWIKTQLQLTNIPVLEKFPKLIELVDDTIKTVRKIATELRPSMLDDFGLLETIEWQASEFQKRTGIECRLTSSFPRFISNKKIEITLFRIFQESLTNVLRHSFAKKVEINLSCAENEVILTITDNGVGMNIEDVKHKRTLGLIGMKERVLMVNGDYNIKSEPGKGTTVLITVPVLANDMS